MKILGKVAAVIAILLVFASIKVFGKLAVKTYNQSKVEVTIEKTLLETSRQINAQLPTMVDKETRLDSTMCLGKQLHYKYTMINVSENDIDKEAFKNEITSMLVKNQCNNDSMVKMLKLGVEYFYIYFDKNGSLIAAINISKNNCGPESQHVKLTPVDYDPFASNQAKQKPSFKSVDEELAYMNANLPAAQLSNASGEPGRDAYVKMLDSYISDGTPAVRLQAVADPAFVTFLNLNDKSTGRLIRDIAEEADRKQDALRMSQVYKSFFTWKKARPSFVDPFATNK